MIGSKQSISNRKAMTLLIVLMMLFGVGMLMGCSKSSGGGLAETAVKEVFYEIKNVSGVKWVLTSSANLKENMNDDGTYLGVSDFTIEPGKSNRSRIPVDKVAKYMEIGQLKELSGDTFEITVRFVAGEYPTDPKMISDNMIPPPFYIQDLVIAGKYNTSVVVEWTGSQFRLAK